LDELLDRAPAPGIVETLEGIVREVPGVKGHHAVRVRRIGGMIEMDVHIQVDGSMSVEAGHEIASEVKHRLREADMGVATAIVHVEPAGRVIPLQRPEATPRTDR
jgi:divalent metal cation (Fe/Co/Zn/Cd) transporter